MLGAWVNDTVKEFKYYHAKARATFWNLKKFWNSDADIKLKIKLFSGSVTESYLIGAALKNKINAFQTQCLQIILNISKNMFTNQQTLCF